MELSAVNHMIHLLRGQRVMLDTDLAELYGVEVKQLKRQVRRNHERFPEDFMFSLNHHEQDSLRCQIGTLKRGEHRKYLPFAFTEQGVAMLSSILKSTRAIQVNIAIMRVFVQLRHALGSDASLVARMKSAESAISDHDRELAEHAANFNEVFSVIRRMRSGRIVKRSA